MRKEDDVRDERGAERTELIERIERTGLGRQGQGRRHDDGGRAERTERTISGKKDDIEDEIINRGREEEEYDRKERKDDMGDDLGQDLILASVFVFLSVLY